MSTEGSMTACPSSSRDFNSTICPMRIPGGYTLPAPLVRIFWPARSGAKRERKFSVIVGWMLLEVRWPRTSTRTIPCSFDPATEPATLQFSSEIRSTVAECSLRVITFPTSPSGVTTASPDSTWSSEPLSITMVLHQFDGLRPITRAGTTANGELPR